MQKVALRRLVEVLGVDPCWVGVCDGSPWVSLEWDLAFWVAGVFVGAVLGLELLPLVAGGFGVDP